MTTKDFPKPPDQEFLVALQRLLKFYSPQELAYTLGVVESTVSRWKNGKAQPNQRDRERVLELLRRTMAEATVRMITYVIILVKGSRPDCVAALEALITQIEGGPRAEIDPLMELELCELMLRHLPKRPLKGEE